MNRLRKYKEILLQIIVFTAMGILLHRKGFYYAAGGLSLLLLSEKFSMAYIQYLNKTIRIAGYYLKTFLFILLFVLVILPIAFILNVSRKQDPVCYIDIQTEPDKHHFEKMW